MRVLLLGPYPPPHGGVQTNLVAIREYVLQRGVSCSVINLTRFRQPDHDGLYFPKSGVEVLRLMFSLRPTILHMHIGGAITTRLLMLGLACTLVPGAQTALTLHSGGYPSSPEGKTASPGTLRGFVFRRFSRLVAVNQELAGLFAKFGVSADRIRLIAPHSLPAGVPEGELTGPLQEFFNTHDPVLLSMGWLEPEYDYPLQIRALGLIRETRPRAGLAILGAGRLEGELRSQIQATSYSGDVLMAGDVPHAVALSAIACCHVYLRTTLYDGDSISVREALHFGRQVVATDNGMRPKGVIPFPASDLEALLGAIERALHQPPMETAGVKSDQANIQHVFEMYQELEAK